MKDRDQGSKEYAAAHRQLRGALRTSRELRTILLGIRLEKQIPLKPVPRYEYDPRANAGYIYLSRTSRAFSTTELTDSINIDYGSNGEVIGVELLHPIHPESNPK